MQKVTQELKGMDLKSDLTAPDPCGGGRYARPGLDDLLLKDKMKNRAPDARVQSTHSILQAQCMSVNCSSFCIHLVGCAELEEEIPYALSGN
jgi:hypothetical protein